MGFLRRLFGGRWKRSARDPNRKGKSRLTFPAAEDAIGISISSSSELDANKHALAVAAATAAVAEAAIAAAQAAAEVVRLTGGGAGSSGTAAVRAIAGETRCRPSLEDFAALRIQSAFRGYLARRALRALKALVKLQALVRGHIVRKQMADMLRRMHTLVRLQSRARANRGYSTAYSVSSSKSSSSQNPRSLSNASYRDSIEIHGTKYGSAWLNRWMENSVWDNGSLDDPALRSCRQEDERSAKILEVDTWMPRFNSQASIRSSPNHSVDHGGMGKIFVPFEPANYSSQPPNPRASLSEEEVASLSLNFPKGKEWKIRSVGNSSIVYCAGSSSRPGSRRGSFTPTRSECSWGYISSYSGHPNYMSNTESSRAKARSQSAPRQRLRTDRYGCSMNKAALRGSWDSRSMKDSVWSYNMTDYSRKTAEDQVSN